MPISRRNFVELCERLTAEDEKAFEALWRRLGLSVDWSRTYQTDRRASRRPRRSGRSCATSRAARPTRPRRRRCGTSTFRTAVAQAELEDRERAGALPPARASRPPTASRVFIETTRPELLAACVALVAHPDDERYQPLFGTTVRTPLFGVEVPVVAHHLADPTRAPASR